MKYRVNDAQQLVIAVPDLKAAQRPCQHAYAFELTGFEVSLLRK